MQAYCAKNKGLGAVRHHLQSCYCLVSCQEFAVPGISVLCLARSEDPHLGGQEFSNKSAASAASQDSLEFQAVIKSA